MIREETRSGGKWTIVENEVFVARGSAHVEARGSASVVAGGSAHVEASGSASVVAGDSASVEARDSAHVEASGSASVVAGDSASVEAWDSASVEASGSASVVARGSASVVARDFSTVHKREKTVKIDKGNRATVIIPYYPAGIEKWAGLKSLEIKNGKIKLWKAVRPDGTDFYSGQISYMNKAIAPDWDESPKIECGHGLHLSDSPSAARFFVPVRSEFRLFQVSVKVKDCVCFGGNPQYPMKLRARACEFVKEFPADYVEAGLIKEENEL